MRARVAGLLAALLAAAPAGASERASTMSRMALFENQTRLLDTRAAVQYEASARFLPPSVRAPAAEVIPAFRGRYRGEFLEVAKAAARRHNVPVDLFLRLVQQESGWNPRAVSSKGATGLAQLMPATAADLGVDINDPRQNLDGGARYLRMMYERFGTWRLALAAYNAGPGAVEEHGGIPPFAETRNYVRAILGG